MLFPVYTHLSFIPLRYRRFRGLNAPGMFRFTIRTCISKSLPVFALLMWVGLLLQGCVRDQMDECVQYKIAVSAVDPQGHDVTSTGIVSAVDIFLFDENGFVRKFPHGASTELSFGASKDSKYTLVAWGNLNGDSLKLPQLAIGTSIENARIELLQSASGYNIPATDLFYGRRDLYGVSTKGMVSDTVRLVMERLIAGLSINVNHVAEHFGDVNGSIHVVVRGTGNSLNFLAEPSQNEAGYAPPMLQVNGKDEWVAPLFRVFPTNTNQQIYIDLYRNDTLLSTITTDDEGNILRALPGKETFVSIDFRGAGIQISMIVKPWGSDGDQNVNL